MDVARLNFSHGSHGEHRARIATIREASVRSGKQIAILLDTKGPEIRTHDVENDAIQLVQGTKLDIHMEQILGNSERISITYPELLHDVTVGSIILIDDGLIELKVTAIDTNKKIITTEVLNQAVLKNKKGVNVPGVSVKLPGITEKDKEDILFGIKEQVDFIAPSFIRKAEDVLELRELLDNNQGNYIQIIPKIENHEGVNNIDQILDVSDGLMVARGDLGVEIPPEEVPLVQKELIKKCNQIAKPVITATQMLDSMQRNPRPTRAEASDVANAIFDGTDAIMLSGETAAGLYPVESVVTMQKIALKAEEGLNHRAILRARSNDHEPNVTDAIGQSVAYTALNLPIKVIIAPTQSGNTAKMISRYRPKIPIIAITTIPQVCRRLALVWGVAPFIGTHATNIDGILHNAVNLCLEHEIVAAGDLTIITAGVPVNESGTTNLMKIHFIAHELASGQGIGRKTATGRVVVVNSTKELAQVEEGSIIVSKITDAHMMEAISKCAGMIVEEGGLTSHSAIVGINLGIPVIVGVENATSLFSDDDIVTMYAGSGKVYKGNDNVL